MFCCNEVFVSFDIYNHFLKCASFKNTYKFRNTASTFEYISIYNMKYSSILKRIILLSCGYQLNIIFKNDYIYRNLQKLHYNKTCLLY